MLFSLLVSGLIDPCVIYNYLMVFVQDDMRRTITRAAVLFQTFRSKWTVRFSIDLTLIS